MTDVRHALRPALRKLALARFLHAALAALAVAAAAWTLLVLLVGKSTPLFLVLSGACAAGVVLRLLLVRTTALDAARRVERLADWREKLSTAVELETAGTASPFFRRLKAEVGGLLHETPAAAFIPWDLQRLAVLAGVLIVAAVSVTTLLPRGVFAVLEKSESAVRRERAAGILQTAVDRLESAALDSPRVNEMRLELAGLLGDIRRDRAIRELDRQAALAEVKIGSASGQDLHTEAQGIAGGLGKSPLLSELAAAVGQFDTKNISSAVQKAAADSAGLNPSERQGVASALGAAGEASRLPGLSDPLKTAGQALTAADIERFQRAMGEFAAEMARIAKRFETERQAAEAARGALSRARAVLAGQGDPGITPTEGPPEFFVEGTTPASEGSGTGNVLVRGKPSDIREVWQQARAADASTPDLRDVLRTNETLLERPEFSPEYRQYVRRYFTVESDNR